MTPYQAPMQSFFVKIGSLVFAEPEFHDCKLIVGTLAGHLFALDPATGQDELLLSLGSDQVRCAEFFDPEIVPKDLSRHEATAWTIAQILTEADAILNLTIHQGTAYLGAGTGLLVAIDLSPAE